MLQLLGNYQVYMSKVPAHPTKHPMQKIGQKGLANTQYIKFLLVTVPDSKGKCHREGEK